MLDKIKAIKNFLNFNTENNIQFFIMLQRRGVETTVIEQKPRNQACIYVSQPPLIM